jgi:pilus assembly protein CpaB
MLKGKTPLIVAITLAVIAGAVAYSAIRKQQADARRGWVLNEVLVATTDMSEGTVITTELVAVRMVPEQFVTASVIKPDSAQVLVGQRVLVPLQAGDPLLWSQFEGSRATERLANKVMKRARAFTIATKPISSVGGWVRPADHVDVLGTFKDPDTGNQISTTIMENVIVLATGHLTSSTNLNLVSENDRTGYNHVSLLVLPEAAEALLLAQEVGELSLSLRNDDDLEQLNERKHTDISTLLSGERIKALNEKHRNLLTIIRGTTAETHEVSH